MAGKFNLNQILTDVSKQAASGGGSQASARGPADKIVKISVFNIVPSDDNFYSMNDIEELKSKIELAGKVLQNLVVVRLEGGTYKVISGHRRRLASMALVEEGKPQYEFVPCVIEENEADAELQAIREEILLIAANSQREKTAWDKIEEVRRTRALLEKVKKQTKIPGGTRDIVAKALKTSPAQIGRYDAIIKNLFPHFMEELKAERINISTAYELSGLSWDEQREAFYTYRDTGMISIRDAKAWKPNVLEQKQIPEKLLGSTSSEWMEPAQQEKLQKTCEKEATAVVTEKLLTAPVSQTETFGVHDESAISIRQLESLRDYCKSMHDSESDEGSRVWELDVDALEFALAKLKQG